MARNLVEKSAPASSVYLRVVHKRASGGSWLCSHLKHKRISKNQVLASSAACFRNLFFLNYCLRARTKTLSDRSDLFSDGDQPLEIPRGREGDNWPKSKCAHRALHTEVGALTWREIDLGRCDAFQL